MNHRQANKIIKKYKKREYTLCETDEKHLRANHLEKKAFALSNRRLKTALKRRKMRGELLSYEETEELLSKWPVLYIDMNNV